MKSATELQAERDKIVAKEAEAKALQEEIERKKRPEYIKSFVDEIIQDISKMLDEVNPKDNQIEYYFKLRYREGLSKIISRLENKGYKVSHTIRSSENQSYGYDGELHGDGTYFTFCYMIIKW